MTDSHTQPAQSQSLGWDGCGHCSLHYDLISHDKQDFCRYMKDRYNYSNQPPTLVSSCVIKHNMEWESIVVFCTVTAFVHPPGPCPAQPLCSMSTAHSSHSNGPAAHTHSRLPLWRRSATAQKTLCFYESSTQVPETCSCVSLMVVTLLFFTFSFNVKEPHFESGLCPPTSARGLTFHTEYFTCTV